MPRQRFNIVIKKMEGGVEVYPMKQWLRQNSEFLPEGLDTYENTSHQIRNTLRRNGWGYQVSGSQVYLIKPDEDGYTQFAEEIIGEETEDETVSLEQYDFPLESHLRDFIVRNISNILRDERQLVIFEDNNGMKGVEYQTGVGPIDILSKDSEGNFVVFELKLSKGPDKAIGQLLRYMGWIKHHLANDKRVDGIIVAHSIDEKLKYAASVMQNIRLLEYEINFNVREVAI